jgi:protein-S-isoprenylcysteine O-methyltransferase Ste14
MDPINIIVGIILIVSMAANFSAAKSAVKQTVVKFEVRPKTWLQKTPPNIAAIVLILEILAIFGIGVIEIDSAGEYLTVRLIGLAAYAFFSWMQVKATKGLGKNYSQEIGIIKNHKLVTSGIYKTIRHPQYVSQTLSDLGAGVALLGYIIIPIVVVIELPLFILRAKREDALLKNHFKEDYVGYKKQSGFMFPFIG